MSFWDEALIELRREFVAGSGDRLEQIETCLVTLRKAPHEPLALSELTRLLHRLSGAGTSFGLPAISALGRRGERECLAVARAGRPATDQELASWSELLASLRAEFTRVATEGFGSQAVRPPGPPTSPSRRRQPPVTEDDADALGA